VAYRVTLKKGNMFDEKKANYMVNASNTLLQLGSGVSAAFRQRCGMTLQEKMDLARRNIGKIMQGDVVATPSCVIDFEYVLHAAVMDYNQKRRAFGESYPSLETVETILVNIENIIKSNTDIKLVLPFFGCGVGGLSVEDVALVYRKFFARKISFSCEVVIYAYSDRDYRIAHKILDEK
jgi:O-acetyl-ADP-ribose deacetylase (regulator of RNase III)